MTSDASSNDTADTAGDEFLDSETDDAGLPPRSYNLGEVIANSVTHGVGVIFSFVATTLLIVFAVIWGTGWSLAGGIVMGVSLILLYSGSTLYHSMVNPKARHVFKIIDHSAIYLLIAGSYTPFCIVTLRDVSIGPVQHAGWWLFGVVWTLATVGISTEAFWAYRPKWLSVVVYLGMGWLVVLMFRPLLDNLTPNGLWLLLAGGLSYTVGTVFYAAKKVPYFHMIWHLFVLAGSVCHFLAVLLYVMPVR
jgi:hemolysin III